MKNTTELKNRAKSKTITNALVRKLAGLESPLKKSYWNTYHCCENIKQIGKTLTSKYCNNRWCATCNRIRTAKLIQGYEPILLKIKDKYFVTLTVPNCSETELFETINKMLREFNKIKDLLRKKKYKLYGIRKLEVTYNFEKNNYHPHFHLIIKGKIESQLILNEWLKRFPDARKIAQDIRMADEKSIKELFKYFTKLVSKHSNKAYIYALDQIFQSMRGKRVFQPFGIKKYVSEDIEELQSSLFENLKDNVTDWQWHDDFFDWVDINSGELLTNYNLSEDKKTRKIISGFI